MYYFVLVACLLGVNFTSSDASLTVDNGLMSGLKFNESIKHKLKHKEKDAITNMQPNMKSIIHSKPKIGSGEQVEDSKVKSDIFPMESFLNLFNVDINNNGQSLADKKTQTNITKNKIDDIDEVAIKTQKEHKSESIESESNGQLGLFTDGLSAQYGSSPKKNNNENVKPVAEGNTGYANILEEIYNDEDLQYILNITHNLNTVRQSINNETHDESYVEGPSPEDVIDIKVQGEDVSDYDAETSRDQRKIKQESVIKEENGGKRKVIVGDHLIKQKESAAGETQNQQSDSIVHNNRIKGDVPDVDYSIEITTIDQNDGNTDTAATAFPRYLENSSERHDHKKEGSLEINNLNLSADPCLDFHCKKGKTCKTDEHGNPFCACQDPDYCLPTNRNDLVCGTDNKTYASACHLFGTKCHLEGTKEGTLLHLDYQGPCKYIPPCTEYELAHFPFRMRDWLKNVLMQLYERDQENIGLLSEKQKSKVKKIYESEKRLQDGDHNIELLLKDFQKNYHMYVYPVHWQFHQLDQHLMDRLLTHSELATLRAPLIPIEHCVNAFLQACNTNNDRHISLWEWCRCFGIKEGDIDEELLF